MLIDWEVLEVLVLRLVLLDVLEVEVLREVEVELVEIDELVLEVLVD